jgi:ornithine lipid ester-linked acyl 2-hydroxylase
MTSAAARRREIPSPPAPASEPADRRPYYRTDGPYAGPAPCFYDDAAALAPAQPVVASWREIRAELADLVRRSGDPTVDVFNPAGPPVPGWRSLNLQTYGWHYHRARRLLPKTTALLDSVPGLVSAFINLLEPHSAVPAHHGDSDAIIRFHLGLDVPRGDCVVRVGTETRSCATGELVAFCDAHDHAAWNATDHRRIVLVFDIMLERHRRRRRWICANVLSATAVIWIEARLSVFRRESADELRKSGKTIPLPQAIRTALRCSIGVLFYLALPLQRRLG